MSGYGSFNYGESESESRTRTGLRGTAYQNQAVDEAYYRGQDLNKLGASLMTPQGWRSTAEQLMPTGRFGMGANADQAVQEYGNMMFGRASANSATRGQVNPENMSAVIGSSITNSLPYLIPQIQQFQAQQFMAPTSLFSTAKGVADYWNRSLGAESDSSSSAYNFGMSGGGGAMPTG